MNAPASHTRRVSVLAASQLMGGIGIAASLSVGGLLAKSITGDTALSGLPQTANVLGAALLAVPLARFAQRVGRRLALITGFLIASTGAAVAVLAAVTNLFPLLLLGSSMFGGGVAAGLQARFAATDDVEPHHRARSLAIVVWATSIGAIAGPNLIKPGAVLAEAFGIPPLAGPYVFGAVAGFLAAVVLLVGLPRGNFIADAAHPRKSVRASLAAIWAVPTSRLGLISIASAHAVMVGIMAMTSVHLGDGGSKFEVIGLIISVHIAGMYALSPLWGWAADRFGPRLTVMVGVGILIAGGAVTAAAEKMVSVADGRGQLETVIGIGLTLIGLGWSACLIAGSSLVMTAADDPAQQISRPDVQGATDMSMGFAGASAGLLSGAALGAWGYSGLSVAGVALLAPVIILLISQRRAR